ncbi:putative selenate ABC transporter substrate-binding protein [Cyanobium sp. CH-040]|uniref:putative selenate ABC transporter substrate-binding protein n=1 Tax=Cyanobium sp. CH-040 TaxID=2823708 RepID=UPI0020CE6533|nr:putative selenate ABC transporter substrate-binding protein [Cyanobium sp. CH-040]MCP9927600.1 putative selenate ABC transporter substrate-binding protein [Cyanobium sp. CH-040]
MTARERWAVALAGLLLIGLLPTACSPRPDSGGDPAADGASSEAARPQEKRVLRIGAIPDQNPEKLNRLYGLVADELSEQLKVPVRFVPVTDYTAAVSAFRTGDLDLVWFGGLTGVQAWLQKPGARALAQRDIDRSFRSVFIASAGSGLKPFTEQSGLQQLRGKRFTFGSESSTSGRLMPQHFLNQAGVQLSDFAGGNPGFSGSHDALIALVQSGTYDAGVVNEEVWESRLAEGKVDTSKVVELWRTPGYANYTWVVQPNLDTDYGQGFTERLEQAFTGLSAKDPRQAQILELFGAERFVPASNDQYAAIEAVGRQIGKIR